MNWFRQDGDVLVVSIHAQPGAKRTEVQGLHGDSLKVRISAPPLEGRANSELQRYLAELFEVPQRSVTQISGETSRQKRFRIEGSSVEPNSLVKNKL
jgi:hypothetical protein